jgi:hypothetical protein
MPGSVVNPQKGGELMSTDVNALELLPAQDTEDAGIGFVTGCDLFSYCVQTCN